MDRILKKKIEIKKINRFENLFKITQNKKLLSSLREIYVSEIKPHSRKKWKFSSHITQNIFILNSKIKIIYYDQIKEKNKSIIIDNKNSYLVTIPKKIKYNFINMGSKKGYIINLLNKKYFNKKK